jgi:hypothetical protein
MDDDKKIKLEYIKKLREDFTGNYIEIIYDKEKDEFDKIYLYDSENGILDYQNGIKKMHRWENEDEAQAGSYLNRRYTSILLDGVTDDLAVEKKITESSRGFITKKDIKNEEMKIINKALHTIGR